MSQVVGPSEIGSGEEQPLEARIRKGLRWSFLNQMVGRSGLGRFGHRPGAHPRPGGFRGLCCRAARREHPAGLNDLGLLLAVVRWPGELKVAARTAMTLATGFSALLYCAVIFAAAPYFASFMNSPESTWVLRVFFLTIVIDGITTVSHGLIVRDFLQDRMAKSEFAAMPVGVRPQHRPRPGGAGAWSLALGAARGQRRERRRHHPHGAVPGVAGLGRARGPLDAALRGAAGADVARRVHRAQPRLRGRRPRSRAGRAGSLPARLQRVELARLDRHRRRPAGLDRGLRSCQRRRRGRPRRLPPHLPHPRHREPAARAAARGARRTPSSGRSTAPSGASRPPSSPTSPSSAAPASRWATCSTCSSGWGARGSRWCSSSPGSSRCCPRSSSARRWAASRGSASRTRSWPSPSRHRCSCSVRARSASGSARWAATWRGRCWGRRWPQCSASCCSRSCTAPGWSSS